MELSEQMQIKKKPRRRHAAPIGGLFIILALVGAATVIITSIRLTAQVLDNSSAKTDLERTVRPVVMFNPAPFESPTDINMDQLLLYSMWAVLTSQRAENYSYDQEGSLRIPASDLDYACAQMFGPDVVELEHASFTDYFTQYYYDKDNNVYNVPVSAELYVYSPQVETIERLEGDLYNVEVGYVPPSSAWTTDFSGNRGEPEPEKHMIYVMRKVKDGYQIVALRDKDSTNLAIDLAQESQQED